jgi:hypothetical protein
LIHSHYKVTRVRCPLSVAGTTSLTTNTLLVQSTAVVYSEKRGRCLIDAVLLQCGGLVDELRKVELRVANRCASVIGDGVVLECQIAGHMKQPERLIELGGVLGEVLCGVETGAVNAPEFGIELPERFRQGHGALYLAIFPLAAPRTVLMEVAHRNDDLTHCAHGVHVAVREWVVCAVDVVEHGSNPERSMAPGGSNISGPEWSIGLIISSLCCRVLLHHLFNIVEFSLTPASLNSPAALVKKQVERDASQLLRSNQIRNKELALQPAMPLRWVRNKELRGTRPAETRQHQIRNKEVEGARPAETRQHQIRNKEVRGARPAETRQHQIRNKEVEGARPAETRQQRAEHLAKTK